MQNKTIEGFRLSPQQKHLWLLQQDSFAYHTQCAICLEGDLNVEVLKQALQKVVNRHEILRTNFPKQLGIKIPIQMIAETSTILWNESQYCSDQKSFALIEDPPACGDSLKKGVKESKAPLFKGGWGDLLGLTEQYWNESNLIALETEEVSAKIEEFFQDQKHFSFNFEQGSLLRLSLLTLSENQHILLISLPSLCADSWTLKNLFKEISEHYDLCLQGEELSDKPVQYIQFSEWQNELLEGEDAEAGGAYWSQQYLQSPPALNLSSESKPNEQIKFYPDVHALRIPPDIVAQIKAIALQYNITIDKFLLACWQTLLYRILKQSDIVINTVSSGRKYEELHTVMGLLAKCLPLRCTFQDNFKFSEIWSQTSKILWDNNKYEEYFIWEENLETAVNVVNLPISFEFEEWPAKYCSGGVSFSLYKQYICFDKFQVKLSCVCRDESLFAEFHYDANLFSLEDIKRLAEQFQTLVESAAKNPEKTVSELEILSDRQRQQLLVEFNNTQTNFPLHKCIHQLFEEQVERTPDNVAVVFEDQQLTYRQLNTRANIIAHYLQNLGVKPEMLVGICVERSLDTVIAMLGILKAGGAYLPLDSALPKDALAFRLQDVQASILLTQQSVMEMPLDTSVQILCLNKDWQANIQNSDTNPTSEVTSENLVYVMFTSGSTGKPKGVAIEHQQLVNYLHAILDRLNLPEGASFAIVSTFAADLGNTAIFSALCTGGCLHIVSQERASNPDALADYFRRHPIDYLKIVPSHLGALLASSPQESILPRQCLILGGEALSWDLLEMIQQQKPNCQILNHYGPTETTIGALTYLVELPAHPKSSTVPLGRPIANTQVYVLDKQLQPMPIGVPGELYISGAGLARGYLNRPELTTERFITNPFSDDRARLYKTGDLVRYLSDGNLEFLGRVDRQVKIRGFRIELEEIEASLAQHPGVQQCVVSVWEEQIGNKRLAAYFVPNKKQTPSVSDLRSFLKEKLADYMVPSAFVKLKALPLTPNGKIDRLSLSAPEQARPELEENFVAPTTEVEQTLATLWQEILHVDKVGINDNFFELGGHSLLLVQVHSKLQGVFNRDVSITDLFKYPTISLLANYFSQDQKENNNYEEIHNQVERRLASRKKRADFKRNI